jgi:hypothetical protein
MPPRRQKPGRRRRRRMKILAARFSRRCGAPLADVAPFLSSTIPSRRAAPLSNTDRTHARARCRSAGFPRLKQAWCHGQRTVSPTDHPSAEDSCSAYIWEPIAKNSPAGAREQMGSSPTWPAIHLAVSQRFRWPQTQTRSWSRGPVDSVWDRSSNSRLGLRRVGHTRLRIIPRSR